MLIDAHAHLDRYADAALDGVLEEIARERIFTLSVAMDSPSYARTLDIARRCELVQPAFGIHPWNAPAYADRLPELAPLIDRSALLGEIGLDHRFVEDAAQYPAQRIVFEFFLAAARDQRKIVNLHTSGAEAETLELLDGYGIRRAIVHWYAGPLDILRAMVERGFLFTVGVEVLSSARIQAIAESLPLASLLTETDNPDGLQWLTGKPGMPQHLREVIGKLAALKQTTPQTIIAATRQNLARLLGDDPRLLAPHRLVTEGCAASSGLWSHAP